MKNKVELLAPAGNFETLLAVINAGADAVYLAGNKFGARAYADNFNDEELLEAIEVSHLFGLKIYLTVNTLLKPNEINSLKQYLEPLVQRGLDGVIVQDLGVLNLIEREFPKLAIHASTQMSIVGPYAVKLLKEHHVTRIVPARECTLEDIVNIKKECDIEVESFIHGAMCYSYSGLCLFSSLLGGRSGNRGRCAQPCRLPYHTKNQKDVYPLSMKDMCTISIISELIEAGVDSFKIEGRMKKAEYAAGVVSVYRKYIDRYYNNESCTVKKEDMDLLRKLYIRNEISEGYYHKHNGRDMITIGPGAYVGADEELLSYLNQKYVAPKPTIPVRCEIDFGVGEPISLSYSYKNHKAKVVKDVVCEAKNAPITKEKLIEQVSKLGDTYFKIDSIDVRMKGMGFAPIKILNEIRRECVQNLKELIIYGQ